MSSTQTISAIRDSIKRPRMLIVEQDDTCWAWIQEAIAEIWPEILPVRAFSRPQVHTLVAEWASAEWEIPKLILADLEIPNRLEGWLLLSELRTLEEPLNQIPIITVSRSAMPSEISKSYRLGCSACLFKPESLSEWLTCFEQLRSYWWDVATIPTIRIGF